MAKFGSIAFTSPLPGVKVQLAGALVRSTLKKKLFGAAGSGQDALVWFTPLLEKGLVIQTLTPSDEKRPMPPETRRPSAGRQVADRRGRKACLPSRLAWLENPLRETKLVLSGGASLMSYQS